MGRPQLRTLRQSRLRRAARGEPARAGDKDEAGRLYREAIDTLNADAPALFLYAPANAAVVARRLEGVEIDPYSWLSGLRRWSAGK